MRASDVDPRTVRTIPMSWYLSGLNCSTKGGRLGASGRVELGEPHILSGVALELLGLCAAQNPACGAEDQPEYRGGVGNANLEC